MRRCRSLRMFIIRCILSWLQFILPQYWNAVESYAKYLLTHPFLLLSVHSSIFCCTGRRPLLFSRVYLFGCRRFIAMVCVKFEHKTDSGFAVFCIPMVASGLSLLRSTRHITRDPLEAEARNFEPSRSVVPNFARQFG